MVSCDSPEKRGLRELAKAGVEPSAKALVQAAIHRDSRQIGWLLDVGVYIEQRDEKGRTPVRIAIENSDLASAFRLLDAKANVNATAFDQTSILGIAIANGETALVEKLLQAGARADGRMPDGEKILPWAIREGRLTFVRAMFRSGADPHLKDRWGNPLLHVAMDAGRRDVMESLLKLGADPGAKNDAGETTLQLAFQRSWFDIAAQLVAAGADPNAPGTDGFTLLEKAVKAGNEHQISLLLKLGADPNRSSHPGTTATPLEEIFAHQDTRLLGIFLTHHATPPGGNWNPWLWSAYQSRNLSAARLLIRHGARANIRGTGGMLLAETAVIERQGSFLKLLLDYGNPPGNALFLAIAQGDLDMVKLLLACGVDADATLIPYQDTPVSLAIRSKNDRIAEALIQHGANVRRPMPEGQSALHLAIATGCHRTVKLLLDRGMDPNLPFSLPVSPQFLKAVRPGVIRWALKADSGVTPLMMAVDSGVISTARYLISAGAKTQSKTRASSLWPINFASRRNDVKMMRVLLGKDPHREERQIVVNLSEQRARLFDADGNELFATKISSGRKGFATPTGEFVITNKHRDWTSTIYHASMPYFQRFSCSDFGFHQGNVPGYPASHGCIRIPDGNAAKLFTLTQAGDRVSILP